MEQLIFVVEDDRDIRESVVEILQLEGYRTDSAVNGQEGINKLHAGLRPDLILLDLMMPVKDGFEFCKEIKADEKFSDIPVVIMSADGKVQEKQSRAGAHAYLRKPIELELLVETVKKYLN